MQRGVAIPLQRAQRASVDLDLAMAPRPHHQVVAVVATVLAFHRRIGVVGAVHVLLVPQALQPHRRYLERNRRERSEEHTSELQSLMRISYAVFCLKKKITKAYYILNIHNI